MSRPLMRIVGEPWKRCATASSRSLILMKRTESIIPSSARTCSRRGRAFACPRHPSKYRNSISTAIPFPSLPFVKRDDDLQARAVLDGLHPRRDAAPELAQQCAKVRPQILQLGDLGFHPAQIPGHQLQHMRAGGGALIAHGQNAFDVRQGNPQGLGPPNELEPTSCAVVVKPVPGSGPGSGWKQPHAVVVPQGLGLQTYTFGEATDRQHDPILNLEPRFKVKSRTGPRRGVIRWQDISAGRGGKDGRRALAPGPWPGRPPCSRRRGSSPNLRGDGGTASPRGGAA